MINRIIENVMPDNCIRLEEALSTSEVRPPIVFFKDEHEEEMYFLCYDYNYATACFKKFTSLVQDHHGTPIYTTQYSNGGSRTESMSMSVNTALASGRQVYTCTYFEEVAAYMEANK